MHQVNFSFDLTIFRLAAIKKASYRFADRYFAEISTQANGEVCVSLQSKSGEPILECVQGEFRNEVLDQDLRETIAEETERVRNLLLAEAFSEVSRLNGESETADFRDDPLGISSN